jgi:hypothetical protein
LIGVEDNEMFSKKSLPITLAFVLLVALAGLGLGYGAWTDQLNISSNAITGNLSVVFYGDSVTNPGPTGTVLCPATFGEKTITISVTNAAPGYHCTYDVAILNTGSISARINTPVVVKNIEAGEADYWKVNLYGSFPRTLAPGTDVAWGYVEFAVPVGETAHENEATSITVTISAEQVVP